MEHREKEGARGKGQVECMHTASLSPFTFHLSPQAGFTFVETLVAIAILLMAIVAPLTLASQGLAASRVARDQVIATYLAQEVIEFARNARDSNTLEGNSWLADLDDCIGGPCMLDVPAGEIAPCPGGNCDPLTFDGATGFYGLSPEDEVGDITTTKFTRSLSIVIDAENPSETLLTATVSWKDGLASRSLSVEESLLDWQ